MPVSFLMGMNETSNIEGFQWLNESFEKFHHGHPALANNQLVYIGKLWFLGGSSFYLLYFQLICAGLRDLDPMEKHFLKCRHITSFDIHDIDRRGIGEVMDMAMKVQVWFMYLKERCFIFNLINPDFGRPPSPPFI